MGQDPCQPDTTSKAWARLSVRGDKGARGAGESLLFMPLCHQLREPVVSADCWNLGRKPLQESMEGTAHSTRHWPFC